jgi:hypothetical protein
MQIDQSSPMEHLKAFAIVFAAGFLVREVTLRYGNWLKKKGQ